VGATSVRTSIAQSINVNAVKAFTQIGPERSLKFLKELGVTTVVETGNISDMNAAALALGGMTEGITPLEMAGAYGAFANGGCYNKPVSYTKVTDRNGEILLERVPQNKYVMDPGVAFIMMDILKSVVTSGSGRNAAIRGRSIAGKTGTTSERYDIWFAGLTPEYSASLWIGIDINLELGEGSLAAARLWGKIMTRVLEHMPESEFLPMPENVIRSGGEYFIEGTQWGSIYETRPVTEEDDEEIGEGEGETDVNESSPSDQTQSQTPTDPPANQQPEVPPSNPPSNPPVQKPPEEEPPPGWLF